MGIEMGVISCMCDDLVGSLQGGLLVDKYCEWLLSSSEGEEEVQLAFSKEGNSGEAHVISYHVLWSGILSFSSVFYLPFTGLWHLLIHLAMLIHNIYNTYNSKVLSIDRMYCT
jgi:hypothetical protein